MVLPPSQILSVRDKGCFSLYIGTNLSSDTGHSPDGKQSRKTSRQPMKSNSRDSVILRPTHLKTAPPGYAACPGATKAVDTSECAYSYVISPAQFQIQVRQYP